MNAAIEKINTGVEGHTCNAVSDVYLDTEVPDGYYSTNEDDWEFTDDAYITTMKPSNSFSVYWVKAEFPELTDDELIPFRLTLLMLFKQHVLSNKLYNSMF